MHLGSHHRLDAKKALIGITHVAYLQLEQIEVRKENHSNVKGRIYGASLTFPMSFLLGIQPA